jgi:DNA modification methylase
MRWTAECVRVLKPGGSFFLYNLPKWNVLLGATSCRSRWSSGTGSP